MKNETTTIEDATLITDYAGHVTNDKLLAIVTDEGVAELQKALPKCEISP